MLTNEKLTQFAQRLRQSVETQLDALVPASDQPPTDLHRAMRHTLMAPGKRVRALLTMFAARHFGGEAARALGPACAVEMVHTASLILDDLPAMDNASLRRGMPANHRVFGEATAILAAVALLNRAYGVIAEDGGLSAGERTRLAEILSRAVGSGGLVAGQEQDLKWRPERATKQDVTVVHLRKTAALFSAAAEMGAVTASASEDRIGLLGEFGEKLGLAFQILDDLLDATACMDRACKDVAQDGGKPSMVLMIGRDACWREARRTIEEASAAISASGYEDTALRHFALNLVAGLENQLNGLREYTQRVS